MDEFVGFFVEYGLIGMFFSAVLAGSIAPFSSELVMAGLQAAGVAAWPLVIVATLGNTLGSLFNYGLGYLGKTAWIARLFKVSDEKMARATSWVRRYGVWAGFLAWIPFLGESLTLAMGLARCPIPLTTLTITIGKFVRYAVLMFAVDLAL
ncbi:MAG: YqaA family protein [Bacteroidales bacterium]|nr:YqaA family protein [Bacteroidales bacterium]